MLMHHGHDHDPLLSNDVHDRIGEPLTEEQSPDTGLDLRPTERLLFQDGSQTLELGQETRGGGRPGFPRVPASCFAQLVGCRIVDRDPHGSAP